jgi:rhodanese-related sulfurtransferase
MSRTRIPLLLLLLCLPIISLASIISGCAVAPPPAPTPTPTRWPPGRTDLDLKPAIRDFLMSLPADWNLMASQDVAQTKPFIVDVRQPEEYGKGFIQGAVNIPLSELLHNLQALPAMDKDILVTCDTGYRSTLGMATLQLLGYKKAKTLGGGLQAWQAAKLPVVTTPVPKRLMGQPPQVNADLLATLDYYLWGLQPVEWDRITPAALTADQQRKSSTELEAQPETFDQGPSVLIDVDDADTFSRAGLPKAINIPLRGLSDSLDSLPLDQMVAYS